MPREFQIESPKDYRDFLVGKLVMLGDELNKNREIDEFLSSSRNLQPEKMEQKINELLKGDPTKKLSFMLSKVADSLQQKGYPKEAEKIDTIANIIEGRRKGKTAAEEEEAEIINLTPHQIKVKTPEGEKTIEPSGDVARLSPVERSAGSINGIPIKKRDWGKPSGLPAPKDKTYYVVSSIILSALPNRKDIIAPDTGKEAVRDDQGRIQAVKSFIKNP